MMSGDLVASTNKLRKKIETELKMSSFKSFLFGIDLLNKFSFTSRFKILYKIIFQKT